MKKGDDRIVYIPRTLKTICDVAHPLAVQTSKRAVYDTLSSVMAFFQSFSGDTTLLRFAFITEWGQLAPKVQRDMYSKYMCHELNVFLYFKDKPFFSTQIAPYLRNKLHKSVLDFALLGDLDQLAPILDSPARFGDLNAFEKVFVGAQLGRLDSVIRSLRWDLQQRAPSPSWSEFQFESALEGQRLVPSDSGDEIRPPGGSRSATGGRLYQDMEKEKTFAECDYYHLPPGRDTAQRVSVNAFWLEYARHLANRPGEPFLSANFVDPVFNFTEMMLALAVLDLPRQASVLPPPGQLYAPPQPAIVYAKHSVEAQEELDPSLVVLQKFFDAKDRWDKNSDGEKEELYMGDRFQRKRPYGCVIIGMCSSDYSQQPLRHSEAA